MSPSRTRPVSGSWRVATMRIRVDLPAPLGPRSPNIPGAMARETSSSARVPFGYVLERFSMRRSMGLPEDLQSQEQQGTRRHFAARKGGAHDVRREARRSTLDDITCDGDDLMLSHVQRSRLVIQVAVSRCSSHIVLTL